LTSPDSLRQKGTAEFDPEKYFWIFFKFGLDLTLESFIF